MCYFKPWYSWSLMVALNTREIRGSNPIKPTFLCPILMHGLFTEEGTIMEAKLYKGFTAVMYLLLYSILLIRVESHLTTGIFFIRNETTSKRLLGTEYVYIQ